MILGWLTIYRKWSCCLHSTLMIPNDIKLPKKMSISYISQSTRTRMFDSVMISQMALVGCQASNKPKMETKHSPNEQQEVPTNPIAWDSEKNISKVEVDMLLQKHVLSTRAKPSPSNLTRNVKNNVWKCSARFQPAGNAGFPACLSRASALLLLGWEQLAWATEWKWLFFCGGFSNVTTWDSERNSEQKLYIKLL